MIGRNEEIVGNVHDRAKNGWVVWFVYTCFSAVNINSDRAAAGLG